MLYASGSSRLAPDSGLPNTLPLNHSESEDVGITSKFWRVDPTGIGARLESDAIRKDWFSSNLLSAIWMVPDEVSNLSRKQAASERTGFRLLSHPPF